MSERPAAVAERIRQLSPEQRALLEKLQAKQQRAARALKPPPIPRASGRSGAGDWPLSFDQERFWFMEQLYPSEAGLNITAASRMRGRVAVPHLAAALGEIARRHAAWRTTFPAAGGRPVQRVAAGEAAAPQRLAVVDLAGLPAARREPEALRLVGEDTAAPFDLERGPLVRSTLVRLSGEDHVCLLTIHHLVTDWISFQIAWGELAVLYAALSAGRRPLLPEPPVQYPDFALWQREWLQGEVLDELVAWWREQLAGVPAALDLPSDRPRAAVPRMRGGRIPWTVPRELADALRALGRGEGATVFMTALAILAAHLHRDSGQESLVLGANNANRNRPEIEPVLGCFLTQVPFAIDLAGDPPFRELLARVRRSALGAYAHQDLPFGKLVEALALPRDPSRPPLVQALVQVLDAQISKTELAGVDFSALDAFDGRARYDLTLSLFDSAAGLVGSLEYDADLFDATTSLRRRERFLLQAAAATADPDLPLSALPVLSAAERQQAAVEWNDTARPLPSWTAPRRFAAQAAATPDALAVAACGEELTYRELDSRAEALARRLRGLGVRAESRVALLLGRTADVPVAFLGVWKAGGAYVPLDPESPPARLAELLADAEPVAVVHRGPLPVELPAGVRSVDLADLDAGTAARSSSATRSEGADVPPGRLAYLIYTSGTTGRPKAVEVEHGSLAAVIDAVIDRAGVGPGDRSPSASRYSFDAALLEILPPLLTGGAVEILAAEDVLDPAGLLAACERATVLFTVPALLRRLVSGARERGVERFARLRVLGVGSDRVPPDLQEEALAAFPAAGLHVLYGPTEATIICAAHEVPRASRPDRALVGRPLPHVELRVVDARGARVALGVPGELWIGGPGVARGYLRRGELTAERFVAADGRRFYRTGDLVRQAPSAGGELEFLGRTDLQVKVRGFRIEPGEVEAALLSHPAVREAVVVARPDGHGENRLIAYCAPAAGTGLSPADLYAHFAARLPAYMIPAAFVALAELPRSASDKVDRARLPAPGAADGTVLGAEEPPATPTEDLVAGIWCDVLALPRVSRHDNFFALGGHSLLATQVVSRLRAATAAEIPIGALFQAPTLEAFASAVEAAIEKGADAPAVPPLVPWERAGDPPLSFAQERLWFLDRLAPGNASYNIPLAIAAEGEVSLPALAAALGEMVARHEALRTTYPSQGDRPVQAIAAPGPWTLPLVDLSALPAARREAESRRIVDGEVARPFDLARDSVLRSLAVRLEPALHALVLVVHHIAADGWSAGVIVEEIAAHYPAARAGVPSPLPPLPVQYADFAVWQRGWLRGEALARQVAYWRERLAGAAALDPATDRPRPPAQSFRGATRMHPLGAAASDALARLARREDATLFMVLLAAVQVLLGRHAGQEDVVVGSPIANRTRAEVEPLIGFFVNSLVLRGDLAGDPTFAELVARARAASLGAFAHQDLPFERLVEELRPDRRLAHNPLFQVMFALQNAPLRAIDLPGLRFAPVEFRFPATRFDLEMLFSSADDGLWAQLTFATDLFDATTIQRLAGHLDVLVAAVTADPAQRLSALPLWAEPERHQVLAEWNDTASLLPDLDLASLVAAQARRRPDAVAVSAQEGELSYGELARRAAALAERLAAAGVGPEARVALLAQRSPEMIVGLLGILAAGGAYVPLDPSYPAERLAFLLADSGARVLLGQRELLAELPEGVGAPVVVELTVDDWAGLVGDGELRSRALPDSLVYVIYTSGSTGRPKGVEVVHRNVVRLVCGSGFAALTEEEVFLQLAPVSFDASTLEIWAPLANGGRVALFPPRRPALEEIEEALARHGVTSLWLTAGLFHQAVDRLIDGRRTSFGGLRQLLAGGDVLSPSHVRRALAALPGTRVVNGYGPTEVTTFTACHPMAGADDVDLSAGASIPIGRPIGNTRVHVLAADLSPVPAGVWGELWAGGEGLSRGYLGRPDLTAERFAPDPFSTEPGARLYRTGDVARFRSDGRLEFRGRRDGQVKVRGYRVELGEIESALARHPGVRAAAVAAMSMDADSDRQPANQAAPADLRLVAYVVPRPVPMETAGAGGEGDVARQVERWRDLYDQTYAQGPPPETGGEAGFNIQGWNSSYTGEPIPTAQMREWRDATVARLRALPHRRVLEVGCGTGLLLLPLAPEAERYRGTDFSAVALAGVQAEVDRRGLAMVDLDLRLADDWSGVAPGEFDLVVLSSVVQYFPGVDYLLRVLRGAVAALGESGAVFLGDVRSLPLLDAFHLSVGLHRASPSLPVAELARRARRDAAAEEELLVDPALFLALARELGIPRVQVLLKRGRSANELTRFRYDVVLHLGPQAAEPPARELAWEEGTTIAGLARRLGEEAPDVLAVRGVPNARVERETVARELLDGAGREMETVGELRAEIDRRLSTRAVEPEDLWELAERLGYDADVSWSAVVGGADGRFDAILRRRGRPRGPEVADVRPRDEGAEEPTAWSAWTNDPLRAQEERRLGPALRRFLEAELPEHMVPSAFVVLESLPLTPNGKVDRAALPAPESIGRPAETWVAPATPTEETLARVVAEVLGIERAGMRDNFFELGGHSLLATQVVSRLTQEHGLPVTLQSMFDAADLGELAARIAERGVTAGAAGEPPAAIPRRPPGLDPVPASFAQERLWFLDRLAPGSAAAYNISLALRLEGALSPATLGAVLGEVVRRHDALRTTFRERDGQPVQVVAPPGGWRLPLVDLAALPAPRRAAEALAQELAMRPFDLARGPLFRATLLRLAAAEHALLLDVHHIVSDGWSMGVLVREITALYRAAGAAMVGDHPSPLPPLPIQYADFAVWQRGRLTGEVLAEQVAHWRERMAGAAASLDLPTDRPRPAVPTYRGARLHVAFGADLTRGLARLARRGDASLFMVLLAGFQALLGRLAGQEDLTVGSPIANRHRTEVEPLIGFFVNTLMMRGDLSGDPSFRELVARTRRAALDAYAHQDLPFERLVAELRPERRLAVTPLFQVVCALQNAPVGRVELPGLALAPIDLEVTTAQFDLELDAWEAEGALLVVMTYSSELFDATAIRRLAGHLETLLGAAIADPARRLSALPLWTEPERHQALVEWNDTASALPDLDLASLVAAQARRRPDAVAVSAEEGELSYGELARRAAALADRLAAFGVGPETRVALLAQRSPEMIVGLLGILAAGGAYVPLDPSYPAERLAFLLEDSGASILLGQRELLDELPAGVGPLVVVELAVDDAAGLVGDGELRSRALPDSLVYVIYTSGSTGRPKGVEVVHRNVVRLVSGSGFAALTEDEVFLQLAPVSFDASTLEIWAPLANGGRVALFPPRRPALEEIEEALARHGVTSLWLTAGLFHQAVDRLIDGRHTAFAGLRQLLAGGDVLSPSHVRRALAALPGTRVIDGYGPTEVTTFTACHPMATVEDVDLSAGASIPIGRPIGNTRVHVLAADLSPLPVGAWGELWAGGEGLSRGYLGRPDLTAERFAPDPFARSFPATPGARLYRTGDIARFRPDGRLEFRGRRDGQVKLRGYRVELGEIESALARHPGVRAAAVAAIPAAPTDLRLVAYVVPGPEPGSAADAVVSELRRFLAAELPDYMVPSAFVFLDALPLTPHGKVDRAALPTPEARETPTETWVAPTTPLEELLARTVADVLGLERVGMRDNFFALGGHSLLATQLVSRLAQEHGIGVSLQTIFDAADLGDLADRMAEMAEREEREEREGIPQRLERIPRRAAGLDVVPASFAQERLWLVDRLTQGAQDAPGGALYNMPLTLRVTGRLSPALLDAVLGAVVRRHESLRTTFREEGGQPVQAIAPPAPWSVPAIDLSALAGPLREAAAQRLAEEDARRPFDLGRGPLLRAALVRLGADDHVLLLVLHHIVSDGWSLGVLVREITALYAAAGQEGALAPLEIQYPDFALWQRGRLAGDALERQLAYWREQLAGAPESLDLPVDRPLPAVPSTRGRRRLFDLGPEVAGGVARLARLDRSRERNRERSRDASPFMVLLAGVQALLSRLCGAEDLTVGSPIANRNRAELEPLIGFFVNTLVLRADLSGDPPFAAHLARTRQTALAAYAHQDLPFERLVAELRPERRLATTPLFQVLLALQNAPAGRIDLPGLALEPLEVAATEALFPLELSLSELDGTLFAAIAYRTELFDAATVERLAGHLSALLRSASAAPETRIADLALLSPAERHQLLHEWNAGARPPAPAGPVVMQLAAQAARSPEAVAVEADGGRLSYADLDRRSDRLARRLRRAGVRAEVPVGLFVERTVDLPAGLLAIWKAGGAFLPLDPALPASRLAFLLADSAAPVVATTAALAPALPPRDGVQVVVVLDGDADDPATAEDAGDPLEPPRPGDLAYLIYTSGTTGQPKAVMVEQGSLASTLAAVAGFFPSGGRVPALAAFSFDIFLFELLGPLLAGGTSVLLPLRPTLDPARLAAELVTATALHAVPALMRQVVDLARRGSDAPSLRALFTGGDAVPADLLTDLAATFPRAAVRVLYGPTEAAIVCASWAVPRAGVEDGPRPSRPPLGRPLDGAEIRLCDPAGRPVPIGVRGEIWIGGAGVARGYWRRPELTAEKFRELDGRRWFASGDLARSLPDGRLEFLGRADGQVKVRGFRIELGEVEAALAAHPDVAAAAAVARETAWGDRQLAAYVVPAEGQAFDAGDLAAFLAARLPEPMVPAAFVPLPALPLTPHGKVDRRALAVMVAMAQEPASAAGSGIADRAAPRTPAEALLAGIWRDVLRAEEVGIHDNFFRLGGDSILAIQVVSRSRQAGLALTPRQLFEHQTIADLAAAAVPLAEAEREEEPGIVAGEVPLTPIQRFFFSRPGPEPGYFNQSLLLAPGRPTSPAALARAVAALWSHHDALRLRCERDGDGWRAWIAPPPEAGDSGPEDGRRARLRVLDLSGLPAERLEGAVVDATAAIHAAFDLARGPLFAAALFTAADPARDRLFLAAHHLVVDAVSWRILLEDLETACAQAEAGEPVRLPAKTTSWKRWAERLAARATAADLRAELPGWVSVGRALPLPLPVDRGEGEETVGDETAVARELSSALTSDLLERAHAAYRTRVDDLLLAALALAFARWTGEPRLALDLEGHGRQEELVPGADLSRTVGWFTTLAPIVLDVRDPGRDPGGPGEVAGPGDAIRAVKERLRAIPRRGVGYGLLRYLAGAETELELAALPSPQVAWNHLGQLDAGLHGAAGGAVRFAPALEPAGPAFGPRTPRRHEIEIQAVVLGGRLRIDWGYSRKRFERGTIERLAKGFEAALAELVAHCLSPAAGGLTPTDVPLAGLDPAALDALAGTGAGFDRAIEDVYPLAPLQEGMLFESLYAPGSSPYFEHMIVELAGPLDVDAFARAWQGVVDRHPALRTAFAWEGLEWPLQVVRGGVEVPWTHEDWRQVPREEVEDRLAAWLAADRARPFDLRRAPLLRAALLRTDERRARFVWSFHHLLFDGWCFAVIFREVFSLYQAAIAGAAAYLPPARPYRDLVAWLAGRDETADDDFFRRLLAGFTEPTRLPLDRPDERPALADGDGAEQEHRLPDSLAADLAAFAEARGLTSSTLVQAAWGLLLARYGGPADGPPDVVFGTVVAGRPAELPGVESIVGLFINTLPMRITADPAAPLDAWLAEVQGRFLELRQHETASLARVQRASEIPAGEPLFQSLVAFENYPLGDSLGEGAGALEVRDFRFSDRAEEALALAAAPGRGRPGLAFRLAHDGRTDATTARRLLAQLELILEGFSGGFSPAAGGARLGDLPALARAERHQILVEWNDTPAPATGRCLHEIVAAAARRAPGALALVAPDPLATRREITYGELDRAAGRLAAHLRRLGVGPEVRVALAVERSPAMVVAVLGVLAAGGAFVPIDPETPADRLAFLLGDARPALLLASAACARRFAETLATMPATRVVTLDAEGRVADGEDATDPPPSAAAGLQNLAYVIYTSGSTGAPKGVAVTHGPAAAYMRSLIRLYGLGPGDRELQFASLTFDVGVEEVFVTLAAGATLVLRDEQVEEPARFLARCGEQGITHLGIPTSYWHAVARALEEEDLRLPPSVRVVITGGERALPERWAAWGRGPGRCVRLLNGYGPTEATIGATFHEHPGTPDPLAGRREVPIGRPLPGVRAYVVDRDLRPLPVGAPGELLLGGVGLTRGYLGRPELTAESFVPDPFAGPASRDAEDRLDAGRLYRTGDLARFLPDGSLEFAGRLDGQVKVRGFRVELGEVEAALADHPEVRDAAAGTRADRAGGQRLIAYVVPRDPERPVSGEALRAFLAARLPTYMVPAQAVFLAALPLTPSDKVDRRALARIAPEAAGEERPFTPPRNAVEERLAAIWREVLGVERVGVDDDFFALGGHSLLATQLASRLRRDFGVELPLARLFELRRLGDLAGEVLARTLGEESAAVGELIDELDDLSDDEALALLAAEGDERGG